MGAITLSLLGNQKIMKLGFEMVASSLKKGVEEIYPAAMGNLEILVSCQSLGEILQVSLNNAPYVFAAKTLDIDDYYHAMSTRFTHLESAGTSLARLVINVFLAVIYTLGVAFTLGLNRNLKFACKKHWIHALFSTATFGTGIIGFFSPTAGLVCNKGVLLLAVGFLFCGVNQDKKEGKWDRFQTTTIEQIKKIYQDNKATITAVLHERGEAAGAQDDLDQRIGNVSTFGDLVGFCFGRLPERPPAFANAG